MLLMLLICLLAQANGLTVTPWCWVVFAVQVLAETINAMNGLMD